MDVCRNADSFISDAVTDLFGTAVADSAGDRRGGAALSCARKQRQRRRSGSKAAGAGCGACVDGSGSERNTSAGGVRGRGNGRKGDRAAGEKRGALAYGKSDKDIREQFKERRNCGKRRMETGRNPAIPQEPSSGNRSRSQPDACRAASVLPRDSCDRDGIFSGTYLRYLYLSGGLV